MTWVALLRAINVGGRNKVPMADLRRWYADAGGRHVATYIQSGNVVLDHDETDADVLTARLRAAVRAGCGVDASVILRTGGELLELLAADPMPDVDRGRLHVTFLAARPDPAAVAELEGQPIAPDRVRVVGRDLYAHLPDGITGARLKPAVVTRLVGEGTTRNWRTVTTLAAMVRDRPGPSGP